MHGGTLPNGCLPETPLKKPKHLGSSNLLSGSLEDVVRGVAFSALGFTDKMALKYSKDIKLSKNKSETLPIDLHPCSCQKIGPQ